MKKVICLFFSLALLFCLAGVAFAHSGGTDANGGHTDDSTGEYHYHHGFPAHQHEDLDGDGVLDCPYDFVVRSTQSAESTYSSRQDSSSNTVPAPSKDPKKEFDPSNSPLFIAGIMLFSTGLLFLPVLIDKLKERRKAKVVKKEAVAKSYDVICGQKALDAYIAEKKNSSKHFRRGDS